MIGNLITIAALIAILSLRFIFDLKIAQKLVQLCGWIMHRSFTRDNPQKLTGDWDIIWESGGSTGFKDIVDRHGQITLYQAW